MTAIILEPDAGPLEQAAREAQSWLFARAAPRWSITGRTAAGWFPERISLEGEADPSYFRTFVQARHIFAFATLGTMGWEGPWQELVGETTEALILRARRADGFFCHRLAANGETLDTRADLYDQAFVLLALATAGAALDRTDWFDGAEALIDVIETNWRHPLGGFHEGEIVDRRVRRQNPHMHLLEAFLALYEASGRTSARARARAIAELAAEKLIDAQSGALLEYFTDDWCPAAGVEGRIAEPGHCFEWAWLFERFAAAGWTEGISLSDRLTSFARRHGLDPRRGVAVNEVLTDGNARDQSARLWPQTERLKAALARHRRLQTPEEEQEAVAAYRGLAKYLDVPLPGGWRDKLKEDGSWIDELAPGSSLYHITCAYEQLLRSR